MIDIQLLRENPELFQKKTNEKGIKLDVQSVLSLDRERLEILKQVEELRSKRNEIADRMKGGKPNESDINEGKQIKLELAKKEEILANLEVDWQTALRSIPNPAFDDVPLGGEEASQEIKVGVIGHVRSRYRDVLVPRNIGSR